jgi:acyl-CoA reductase-like NAD-dependent aldehyde dehydrogenase
VQSILKFETTEELIQRANATNYGLAAGVLTRFVLSTSLSLVELRKG